MNPTVVKVLQVIAILFVAMIALNLITAVVYSAVRLLLNIALLTGLCLLVYHVLSRVKA